MICLDVLVGLPGFKVTGLVELEGQIVLTVRHEGEVSCALCGGRDLRSRDLRVRRVRHVSMGDRPCVLQLESRKWRCRSCDKSFWQRFPGILPHKRASEPFRKSVSLKHWDGIDRKRLGERERIGSATVERWFQDYLGRRLKEREGAPCPRILGIDEHFFSRRQGYATTFCDLGGNKIYDVVLGRSEASLQGYLRRMKDKDKVEMVCIDLSTTYRSLVRNHFPKARIVADRFHVVKLINHHFLTCWRQIDPTHSKNRGLISLMRRHRHNLKSPEQTQRLMEYLDTLPGLKEIYRLKQRLTYLILKKHRTSEQCKRLIPRFLKILEKLKDSRLPSLVTLGETLESWAQEIVTMWRFTKNNGITEGFHNKMETLSRKAYGFRNFESYRLRVRVMCS